MSTFHRREAVLVAALLASLGLLAAGCGGSPSASVANLGTTTTSTTTGSTGSGAGSLGSAGPPSGGGVPADRVRMMLGGSTRQLQKFASCMRANGEPDFPDPNAQGQITGSTSSGFDPGSPQFQRATQTCRKDLPNGGVPTPAQQAQARQNALAFSACMRSHGVPKFPDPQFGPDGRVSIHIDSSSGIDPMSPEFQNARKACAKDLPGGPGAKP
jgi:hypothetical protein